MSAKKSGRKSARAEKRARISALGSRKRIGLLLAANVALIVVLWSVAGSRLIASEGSVETQSALPAATPAPMAPMASAVEPIVLQSQRDRGLETRIRAAISAALAEAESITKRRVRAADCAVAVHVRTASNGTEIASIEAARAQRPASNLKLVTTTSALVLLGPTWNFTTHFLSDAAVQDGILQGDLVVYGGGDPLYDPESGGSVAALLAPVVNELKARGIMRVAGDIVLHEGSFLAPGPGPAWPATNQHWAEFCALSGGFTANAGCLTARVQAARAGQPATVDVQPAGHGLPMRIGVTTGSARTKLNVRVGAANGTVVVEGSIPADVDAWEARFAAPDPVALFGGALREVLQSNGIRVAGSVRRDRPPVNANLRPLAKLTTPLLDVLVPINAHSNNACADQLFFALGDAQFGRGDRAGGQSATSLALRDLGVPDDGFQQVDGSGLSRDDRVSARQITALLAGVLRRSGPAASALLDSMAAPRADGTLDDRLAGLEGRLRAKTGFIGGTSALSGVIDADDGRSLVFSILVEYPVVDGLNTRVWKPMEDRICRVIASGGK